MMIVMVMMAVVSTGSAEVVAVTSILVYDIYQLYLKVGIKVIPSIVRSYINTPITTLRVFTTSKGQCQHVPLYSLVVSGMFAILSRENGLSKL